MKLGIDFGTSFSKIATIDLDQPVLLLNPGEYGIPSEFYYDREYKILVGQDALDAGQGYAADNLVSEVKMSILSGKDYSLDGRTFSSQEIVKEIYKKLITKAMVFSKRRLIDNIIEEIVISVPAKFGVQERELIRNAAKESVKECLDGKKPPVLIIDEPVAAALSYYRDTLEDNKHILVYDLGGGTCDIALVKADSSLSEHFTVVDKDMIRVGGRNWDEELEKYIAQRIQIKSGISIEGNAGLEEKIRRAAIRVKHDLSDPSNEQSFFRVELNNRMYTESISKKTFDEITLHLLRRTFDCLQEVYDSNSVSCIIDEIICVGGGSNMLQVEEGLLKRFPHCRIRLYKPEHAVVYGTAIYANMPHKESLVDISNFSYGTDTNTHYGFPDNKKVVLNLITCGDKLPANRSSTFCPVEDNQETITFKIYESEITDREYEISTSEKRYVGQVTLKLPPNTAKSTSVLFRLKLNPQGLLEVRASEPSGEDIEAQFEVKPL